jgi:hypothetical protein
MLVGCDFSSSPSKRKPIVIALGSFNQGRIHLQEILRFDNLDAWSEWLKLPQDWIGGFDLPFGLPRELVESLHWPNNWLACTEHFSAMSRDTIRQQFKAFCDARPVGQKFAHRKTDGSAGSSPSMKWVNPPVAFMLHAGVPRLLDAGVELPGLHTPHQEKVASRRIALEAYPGLLARELLGNRSYKSDDKAKQTPERLIARKQILQALETGQTRLDLKLKLTHAQHDALVADASGDTLDAVLCMVQAAWAELQHNNNHPCYGLPIFDSIEGWIVTA